MIVKVSDLKKYLENIGEDSMVDLDKIQNSYLEYSAEKSLEVFHLVCVHLLEMYTEGIASSPSMTFEIVDYAISITTPNRCYIQDYLKNLSVPDRKLEPVQEAIVSMFNLSIGDHNISLKLNPDIKGVLTSLVSSSANYIKKPVY